MSSKRSLELDSSESDSLEALSARCVVLGSHLTSGGELVSYCVKWDPYSLCILPLWGV